MGHYWKKAGIAARSRLRFVARALILSAICWSPACVKWKVIETFNLTRSSGYRVTDCVYAPRAGHWYIPLEGVPEMGINLTSTYAWTLGRTSGTTYVLVCTTFQGSSVCHSMHAAEQHWTTTLNLK